MQSRQAHHPATGEQKIRQKNAFIISLLVTYNADLQFPPTSGVSTKPPSPDSFIILYDPQTKVCTIPMIPYAKLLLIPFQPSLGLTISTDPRQMYNPLHVSAFLVQELHDRFVILMLTDKASSNSVTDCPKHPA
ncbi:hypothetical protein AC579_5347 [Pseudocercospora musae]|uniref:Uncharacterized protein n=1 Tax=Pseudocercospora musae TaxID=113226 RepID=A0A139ISX4_9PEZI|nr:hypothetical protein AC579_5347 [Pseudocercospora musae]